MKLSEKEWEQVALAQLEADPPEGRAIWCHDGQLGFARFMRPDESRTEAIKDFENAGEECKGWRMFNEGE